RRRRVQGQLAPLRERLPPCQHQVDGVRLGVVGRLESDRLGDRLAPVAGGREYRVVAGILRPGGVEGLVEGQLEANELAAGLDVALMGAPHVERLEQDLGIDDLRRAQRAPAAPATTAASATPASATG